MQSNEMSNKDERGYIFLHAGKKIRFRNIARVIEGDVESFIQVELIDDSKRERPWMIFRCDKKQNVGYHVDMYDINDEKVVSHQVIKNQTPEGAVTEIMEDLKKNLEIYLKKLGFTKYIVDLPPDWKDNLDNARNYLLESLKEPSDIIGKKTQTALGITADAVLISDTITVKLIKGEKEEES